MGKGDRVVLQRHPGRSALSGRGRVPAGSGGRTAQMVRPAEGLRLHRHALGGGPLLPSLGPRLRPRRARTGLPRGFRDAPGRAGTRRRERGAPQVGSGRAGGYVSRPPTLRFASFPTRAGRGTSPRNRWSSLSAPRATRQRAIPRPRATPGQKQSFAAVHTVAAVPAHLRRAPLRVNPYPGPSPGTALFPRRTIRPELRDGLLTDDFPRIMR